MSERSGLAGILIGQDGWRLRLKLKTRGLAMEPVEKGDKPLACLNFEAHPL